MFDEFIQKIKRERFETYCRRGVSTTLTAEVTGNSVTYTLYNRADVTDKSYLGIQIGLFNT